MKIICHRRNTIQSLRDTPKQYGVEVDIRSIGNYLIVQHEPFALGETFQDWLAVYQHNCLILNVKEDGLEHQLSELMQAHHIQDYFFVDQPITSLLRCDGKNAQHSSIRVSEYERPCTALKLAGKATWIWVDCFTKLPLDGVEASSLQAVGYKLCLVSPEIHGHDPESSIPALRALLKQESIHPDAVCTHNPDLWEN